MLSTTSLALSYAAPSISTFPFAVHAEPSNDCVLTDQDVRRHPTIDTFTIRAIHHLNVHSAPQCTGGKTCCQPTSPDTMTCEAVNQWYSKCVFQPQCVNATNTNPTKKCEGTADQIMNETACCDATESCVPFGDTWKMCRTSDIATCSVTGEQCWGKNDSYTPMSTERPCCDPNAKCVHTDEYWGGCSASDGADLVAPPQPTPAPTREMPRREGRASPKGLLGSSDVDKSKSFHCVDDDFVGDGSSATRGICQESPYKWDMQGNLSLADGGSGWGFHPLMMQGDVRAYGVASYPPNRKWKDITYERLHLLGKKLRWNVNVSNAGCGCNAALYLVDMPDGGSDDGAGYCDVQTPFDQGGCLEIDLFEGNTKAMATTLHTLNEQPPQYKDDDCNQWGCQVDWGKDDASKYSLHNSAGGIDSSKPFEMEAAFDAQGGMTVTITQGSISKVLWDENSAKPKPGSAARQATKAALEKGLVLVTSLWQADGDGMSWLDGGCDQQHPHCNLNASTAVFSDVAVV